MDGRTTPPTQIHGECDPRFAAVAEEFLRNFVERGEVGAAVAIFLRGDPVVDLWGGVADPVAGSPWRRDTLALGYSATKGMAATCLAILIDRGLVAVDEPVATYWPAFAANGKAGVTVGMALSHQAGLPYWEMPVPDGGLFDWNLVTSALAAQKPAWEPGMGHGYHGLTSGFIWGEIVRRVTGTTIGSFLRDEVARPLGADVWIGLPESEHQRVAQMILPEQAPAPSQDELSPDVRERLRLLSNCGGAFAADTIASAAFRLAEIPAAGGMVSARGLARVYAPLSLDGEIDGVRIVDPGLLPALREVRSASSHDRLLGIATSFTLGFSQSWGDRALGPGYQMIIGEKAFGTPGLGGSIGFADGEAGLSFAYVMNRLGPGVALNERGQALVDAAYNAVGYSCAHRGRAFTASRR
ncbi:CubicO group peptidase (beta-lactamase class C family) [Sphingomonas zeicaulis]|uniref:serine hydrolase domain-containing protein n=1 Tax=Sphingomonas zeicaulis TaxID=1632740 RepID=UPI003D25D1F4